MTGRASIVAELQALAQRQADLIGRLERLDGAAPTSEPEQESGSTELKLLTAAEVAQLTGLPRGRIYQLGREGKAGAVHIGERGVRLSGVASSRTCRPSSR